MQQYHQCCNFQEPLRGYQDEESRYRECESAKTQKPSVHYLLEALCVSHFGDDDGSYLRVRLYLRESKHLGWIVERSAIFDKTEGRRTKPNVPSSNIPVKNSLCLQYASCQQQHHQVLLLFVYSC